MADQNIILDGSGNVVLLEDTSRYVYYIMPSSKFCNNQGFYFRDLNSYLPVSSSRFISIFNGVFSFYDDYGRLWASTAGAHRTSFDSIAISRPSQNQLNVEFDSVAFDSTGSSTIKSCVAFILTLNNVSGNAANYYIVNCADVLGGFIEAGRANKFRYVVMNTPFSNPSSTALSRQFNRDLLTLPVNGDPLLKEVPINNAIVL